MKNLFTFCKRLHVVLVLLFIVALVLAPQAFAACDPSYQTLIYTAQGGADQHVCSGGSVTFEAGSTLTLASTSSLVETNVDLVEKSLTATYGILGSTLGISGATNLAGAVYIGAANHVSTFPAAGSPTLDGTLTAGALVSGSSISGAAISGTTGAFSSTLDVAGNVYQGAALYRSTFTASNGNMAYTGTVTAAGFAGSGASLTALPAAQVTGTLPVAVTVYSSADCEALTPAAIFEFCGDTGTGKLNISTSTAAGGFAPLAFE